MWAQTITTALLLLPSTFSSPFVQASKFPVVSRNDHKGPTPIDFHCALPSNATPDLPAGQTNITLPDDGEEAFAIGLGRGVQNYTCTSGNWVTAGAVATVYDASCLAPYPNVLKNAPQLALKLLPDPTKKSSPKARSLRSSSCQKRATDDEAESRIRGIENTVLGHHYFVTVVLPGAVDGVKTLSPKFDFTPAGSPDTNPANYIILAKKGVLDAPTGDKTKNVQWLELAGVEGSDAMGRLAKTIYRVDTAGGQPPASCSTEGENLSVEYAANYWLYK